MYESSIDRQNLQVVGIGAVEVNLVAWRALKKLFPHLVIDAKPDEELPFFVDSHDGAVS